MGLKCATTGRLRPANLVNSNEARAVRRGGNVNNGANAGPCYFNAYYNPSNANWNYGSALSPFPAPACHGIESVNRNHDQSDCDSHTGKQAA